MNPVPSSHIWLDSEGRAWLDDTNVKIIEVALDQIAYGWSADEIHYQHAGHLSMAQIHAALAYYFDHQAEFDQEIKRQAEEDEAAWAAQDRNAPLFAKLRAAGKIK